MQGSDGPGSAPGLPSPGPSVVDERRGWRSGPAGVRVPSGEPGDPGGAADLAVGAEPGALGALGGMLGRALH